MKSSFSGKCFSCSSMLLMMENDITCHWCWLCSSVLVVTEGLLRIIFLDTVRSQGAENNWAYVNLIDATEMGSLKDSSSLVSWNSATLFLVDISALQRLQMIYLRSLKMIQLATPRFYGSLSQCYHTLVVWSWGSRNNLNSCVEEVEVLCGNFSEAVV